MSTVIQLAIVLGIMVLVHEFGHFVVAKLCGIRVEVFSIGFGKRLIGFKRGDTEYQIAVVPLGGYVKMAGEMGGDGTMALPDKTETDADDRGNFNTHPRWQRMLVAFAGPIANFLLAFALMIGVSMLHNEVQQYLSAPAQTDYVPTNTQVARTGIESGDTIVRYDTVNNPTWDQVAVRSMLNLNQSIDFSYVHDGKRVNTKLFVEDKNGPDNFSLDELGLIPIMQTTPVEVDSLEPNMPAIHAGLKSGDKITAIDGLRLHSVPAILAYLQDQAGKPATLTVLRTGPNKTVETVDVNITPQMADAGDGTKEYRLGFSYISPPVKVERLPFGKAVEASWKFNKKGSLLIVEVIKRLFTRQVSVKSLSSPIGIGQQIHQAAEMPGWMPLIGLMAYISLNLGIFNLLPIPILDGGMIMFLVIESIMRRDVNQQFKERVYQVAFVCLLAFFAFVIFNDITKLSFFTKVKP
ncbi:putative zinc metalloprotease [Edaphobacter acidisoli]|uniref:Zinc metalloprotease n=1 Tax=Edaphobacter acidisoli TaxID=2040573 RepID=A0A916RN39_9BACT|nr:RIP metalloprotease RseP [Edaphobacter acidisoli]GGA63386.1 putative zinc metalloprotease [Edaphobacter acidisoli]